ncbi:MAG: response regulator [Desulfobacterales bacterium]|nr:response regulator [Desulfobacterales bacterium]
MFQNNKLSASDIKAQKIRKYRFKLALITYVIAVSFALMVPALGLVKISLNQLVIFLTIPLIGNTIFFFIFHTNLNLKFKDQSLTTEQIIYANLWGLVLLYMLPSVRSIVLMFLLPAFSFGMLRLTLKQHLYVVLVIMPVYATILFIEFSLTQREISWVYEFFLFFLYGVLLMWFAVFGGMVSKMRNKLRKQNRKVIESNLKYRKEKKEREKTSKLLDAAIQQSPSGVIIADAPDAKIKFVNQAAHIILGEGDSKLTDVDFAQYSVKWKAYKTDGVTPYSSTELPLSKSIKKGEIVKNEEIIVRSESSNKVHWVSVNSAPVYDNDGNISAGIVVFHDITEQKKTEKDLKTAHERFFNVLNSIDASIYVTEIDTYEILFMNRYMIKAFGRDMTGEKCFVSFRGKDSPCSLCKNENLIDSNGKPLDVCIWQDKNPINGRWYINYDRAIEWTNGHLVKVQIATDITDLKTMEKELRHSHKMESVGTLAGGIAHDFNNILGIILGNAELALKDVPESNPAYENIDEIKIASLRAKDVIKQLLSFSRKTEEEKSNIDIVEVLNESMKLIKSSISSNVKIYADITKNPGLVFADPTQIHQIIINLCTNSAHAMPENGGVINISLNQIDLNNIDFKYEDAVKGRYLELIINDTGSGIDSEIQEKIFDPYFTTKDVGKGTGMGLAVVHGIVKNHNGYIYIGSQKSEGTTFTILLPVSESEVKVGSVQTLMKDFPTGNESILFIDDEAALSNTARMTLSKLGYKAECFVNPDEALSVFKTKPESFDLVISDLSMPQMNGLKLCEKIKNVCDIPTIICTGHLSFTDKEKAKDIGISAYLMKPITMSEMAVLIRQVLDK